MKLVRNVRIRISAIVIPPTIVENIDYTVRLVAYVDKHLESPLVYRTQTYVSFVLTRHVKEDLEKLGSV